MKTSRAQLLFQCIEDDIPDQGFFDRICSPEKPFSL